MERPPVAAQRRPPGITLALSGGGARGIAHIGVLEALAKEGIPVRAVAGTSAGAIVGALFAAGVEPAQMLRLALDTKWLDFFRVRLPRAGLLPGDGLEEFLERVLPARTFAELRLPFVAVATDLASGRRVDLAEGSLSKAVRASCSVPVLLEPVALAGRLLVDGGISSQVPVRAARERLGGAGVVAVNVNDGGLERPSLDSAAQVAVHLGLLWTARTAAEEEPLADVRIGVDARGIPLHDLGQATELLRRGREGARRSLSPIRALLGRLAAAGP